MIEVAYLFDKVREFLSELLQYMLHYLDMVGFSFGNKGYLVLNEPTYIR